MQVLLTLRCLVLLLVRYLGFITEGNTLPSLCYIIPPSPGKYRRSSSCHQGESLAPLPGRIFNITRFLITNLISLQFTLFAICLSFSSPTLHKNLLFYSPLFFFCRFLARSVFVCFLVCVVMMPQRKYYDVPYPNICLKLRELLGNI